MKDLIIDCFAGGGGASLIQENGGEIPVDWIGFADRPTTRKECDWWNK